MVSPDENLNYSGPCLAGCKLHSPARNLLGVCLHETALVINEDQLFVHPAASQEYTPLWSQAVTHILHYESLLKYPEKKL
jgi:hypothetical protein